MQKYYYQRLRDIREDREKTQKEIAEVLNTTYQYYSAYERGVRDIPSHHIKLLRSTTISPQTTFWDLQTSRKR